MYCKSLIIGLHANAKPSHAFRGALAKARQLLSMDNVPGKEEAVKCPQNAYPLSQKCPPKAWQLGVRGLLNAMEPSKGKGQRQFFPASEHSKTTTRKGLTRIAIESLSHRKLMR